MRLIQPGESERIACSVTQAVNDCSMILKLFTLGTKLAVRVIFVISYDRGPEKNSRNTRIGINYKKSVTSIKLSNLLTNQIPFQPPP